MAGDEGTGIAFNNKQFSDVTVILTSVKNSKLFSATPSNLQGFNTKLVDKTNPSVPWVKIFGHKVILSCRSKFFASKFQFQQHVQQDNLEDLKQSIPNSTAVITVNSDDLIPVAKAMVRFMYTLELEDDWSRADMVQLYMLAHEYQVATLQIACLQRLAETEVQDWHLFEQQALCGARLMLQADDADDSNLGKHARKLCNGIEQLFINLEVVWRSTANREMFCSLPYDMALRIVQKDDLVVRSENTVLVVVLSWLQGPVGQAASKEQRKAMLRSVRLLQLSPWFQVWLLHYAREGQALLSKLERSQLMHHGLSPMAARKQLEQSNELLRSMAAGRSGYNSRLTMDLEVCVPASTLAGVVAKCYMSHGSHGLNGKTVYFNGFEWTPTIHVARRSECVNVWAGIQADLALCAKSSGEVDDVMRCDLSTRVSLGGWPNKSLSGAGKAALGCGWGWDLTSDLKPDDDVRSVLATCFTGDELKLQVTVLS